MTLKEYKNKSYKEYQKSLQEGIHGIIDSLELAKNMLPLRYRIASYFVLPLLVVGILVVILGGGFMLLSLLAKANNSEFDIEKSKTIVPEVEILQEPSFSDSAAHVFWQCADGSFSSNPGNKKNCTKVVGTDSAKGNNNKFFTPKPVFGSK